MYSAYVLSDKFRSEILAAFPPRHRDVICHHVTEQLFGKQHQVGAPPTSKKLIKVVGYAYGDRVEAVVVTVDGATSRPDGRFYHITLSIDRAAGAKPVDSNELIKNGFTRIDSNVSDFIEVRLLK